MARAVLLAALLLAGPPAFGQTIYGDDGGCRRVAGEPAGTDLVFVLYPDRVERWESSCAIVGSERFDATSVELITQCSGEGETWEQRYVLTPLSGQDGYLIGPAEYDDIRFEVRPCQ